MSHQCKLLLDNYTGQYLAGSSIQGRVLVDLSSDTTIRGVRVTLTCKEHTSFMGTESYYDSNDREQKSRDTQFTGDRDTFEINQWLYGDQHGSTSLSAGQHVYPFQINLQPNIPGTYSSEKGSISYQLRAVVDKPMSFDYEDQILLQVNSPVDLNFLARPEDLQPTSYSDEKTVCCWCCAQGPITLDVEFPKKTLIPGEQISVKAHLTNMSNTNIEGISLELTQKITYEVTEPDCDDSTEVNTLVKLRDVGLGAHGENTYIFQVVLPPQTILPNFTQCKLFSVDYKYKINVKLPSMHNDLEVQMHPKVGHIPLGASNQGTAQYNPQPSAEGGLYPSVGWVGGPTAPPASAPLLDPKGQEASGYPTNYNQGSFEPSPPSYDSLNMR